MKRLSIIIAIATAILMTTTVARSQNTLNGVNFSQPVFTHHADSLTVAFGVDIGRKAVSSKAALVIVPEIYGVSERYEMPPIVAQGRNAHIAYRRNVIAGGAKYENALFARRGDKVNYKVTIPYLAWMEGATLNITASGYHCGSWTMFAPQTPIALALPTDDANIEDIAQAEVVIETPDLPDDATTGEKLAARNEFIAPVERFDEKKQRRHSDDALKIAFTQGSAHIINGFADNSYVLRKLMSSIHAIESSRDSNVAAIVITGYASPEGDAQYNEILSWKRAAALKDYIVNHSYIDPRKIRIYSGGIDWLGLRKLIDESEMPWKWRAMDIIDNVPVWDKQLNLGKHGELMRLGGGSPYRYMYIHFFPQLRNAAYVEIYYENKQD
jgi:outer membrane protein OmpA-like peptidoglycan-associated protein